MTKCRVPLKIIHLPVSLLTFVNIPIYLLYQSYAIYSGRLFNEINLFIWILRQESGNNLCGYYVCEYIMVQSNRIPKEYLRVRNNTCLFLFSLELLYY